MNSPYSLFPEKVITAGVAPKVGDVLVSKWGYDQDNATFFAVTKVTNARVTVQELRNIETSEKGNWMFGTAVPDLNAPKGLPQVKGFKPSESYGYFVKVSSYMTAFPWDGKPCDVSHTH